jgi:hypothetical protein
LALDLLPYGSKVDSATFSIKTVINDESKLSGRRLEAIFQEILCLPKKNNLDGEEGLMLAVLENAIECFQRNIFAHKRKRKRLYQEAEEWILEKDSDWCFSFEFICETLDLHPDYIRQGLLSWKEAKCKERFIQAYRRRHKTFVKTRVAHTSVRRSKTA